MTNPCEGLELPKGVKKSKYHTIVVDENETGDQTENSIQLSRTGYSGLCV